MENNSLTYNVDVVMCIDCTGSMQGILNTVKANALKFYPDLRECCEKKDKHVAQLRIRLIGFRDFYADGERAIEATDFFDMATEEMQFKRAIENLQPWGGGDEPENGLEALALAMDSPWTREGSKKRHVIVIWSDASTHPLEESKTKNEFYPANMPKDFNELTDWWEDKQNGKMPYPVSKRLIIFAPDASAWTEIGLNWEHAIHHPAKAGEGLEECDYETILAAIANSI